MRSQQFLNGIHYELQNRAFALSAITSIANRVQGTQEYIFWSAYEKLERFNTTHYFAMAVLNKFTELGRPHTQVVS